MPGLADVCTLKKNMIRKYIFLLLPILSGCAGPNKAVKQRQLKVSSVNEKPQAARLKSEILKINDDLFEQGQFITETQDVVHYRLLRPGKAHHQKNYPLLVIFPTSGGIGTDNKNQMNVLVKFWAQDSIMKKYPVYVLALQYPVRSSNYKMNTDQIPVSTPALCMSGSLKLIDSLQKTLQVDPQKIYTVGFSMGASTANNAMIARPDLFKAAICISGIPKQDGIDQLKNIPLLVIHGNKDEENSILGDRALYQKLKHIGHPQLTFLEIEGMGHEIYPPLYTTDMVPKWFFSNFALK